MTLEKNSASDLANSEQEETSVNFPGNAQKWDATIFVAILQIALVDLVDSNDVIVS